MNHNVDNNIPSWQERTALLFGDDVVRNLRDCHVLIVGLGGVGGYATEMIARAGVGHLTIVDQDIIQPSNINRQIIALHSNISKSKASAIAERLRDINPEIKLNVLPIFLKDNNIPELIQGCKYDYIVDAIDTLSPKVYLIKTAIDNNIPIISSMGAGAKSDPMSIRITDVSRSYNCSLARAVRKRLRKLGLNSGFPVIYSEELPNYEAVKEIEGETCKKSTAGTVSYMPALFGCHIGAYVIRFLSQSGTKQ